MLADLDVVTLSRVQFALTIMFHYLFPPLTIGLGVVLVCLGHRTCGPGIRLSSRPRSSGPGSSPSISPSAWPPASSWSSSSAPTGPSYSRYVGDVFGSALAAEGIFAFFLESGSWRCCVFGWDRVGPRMHFFATCMVALGSIFSAVWIVVANSWQQTPAGQRHSASAVHRRQAVKRAEIADFWAMVFNPSSMNRLVHVLLGAFILGAFFV